MAFPSRGDWTVKCPSDARSRITPLTVAWTDQPKRSEPPVSGTREVPEPSPRRRPTPELDSQHGPRSSQGIQQLVERNIS